MTTRQVSNALGVGLTTVQLWVESGMLPAWKTAGGHRRIPREAVERLLSEQTATLEGIQSTVLVVEDSEVERELYRQHFNEWKLPVTLWLAEDGYEGLLLAGRHQPDFIIADLSMPGMNGFRMIQCLYESSQESPPPKLVVVTGLTPEQIAAEEPLPSNIPVYPKPIPFPALRQIIQHHVQSKLAIRNTRFGLDTTP